MKENVEDIFFFKWGGCSFDRRNEKGSELVPKCGEKAAWQGLSESKWGDEG